MRNTGGSAFPIAYSNPGPDEVAHVPGMTLRDYFAAAALPAIWSGMPDDLDHHAAALSAALCAYNIADAMLKARGKA